MNNTATQLSQFRTKNWVEVSDGSCGTYGTNSQIRFKTIILKSILCDYSDTYILVKETITFANTAVADADANNINRKNV